MLLSSNDTFRNTTSRLFFVQIRPWDKFDTSLAVLFCIGLIGNILTIAVFRSKSMRNNNEALFLTTMSTADIFFLFTKFISNIQKLYHIPIYNFCIYLQFVIPQAVAWISPWLIVLTTIERTVAVWKPMRVTSIFSRRLCVLLILFICLFYISLSSTQALCLTYSPQQPYYCQHKGKEGSYCHRYLVSVFPWLKSSLMSWLPCLIALILNTIIIFTLYKASKKRKLITQFSISSHGTINGRCSSNGIERAKKRPALNKKNSSIIEVQMVIKEHHITITLLAISLTFILLTLPYSTFELLRKLKINLDILKDRHALRSVMFLLDCLHAINFILYCLTGARFRHALEDLICGSLLYRVFKNLHFYNYSKEAMVSKQ